MAQEASARGAACDAHGREAIDTQGLSQSHPYVFFAFLSKLIWGLRGTCRLCAGNDEADLHLSSRRFDEEAAVAELWTLPQRVLAPVPPIEPGAADWDGKA
jgi:hypothetical protein